VLTNLFMRRIATVYKGHPSVQ